MQYNSLYSRTRKRDLVVILGIPFDNLTMEEVALELEKFIVSGKPHYLATANVNFVVKALQDPEFQETVQLADIITADGTPILWAAKMLGAPLKERVAGSDLVPYMARVAAAKGYRIFLLGGAPGVGEKAATNLMSRHPGLQVYCYSPPFDPLLEMNNEKICKIVRSVRPDMLFVSFTAGKSEKWIRMNLEHLGVPVCAGVGATIDFLAGRVSRAPVWMRRVGLEWLYRTIQEPGRMWRRYFFDFLVFARYFIRQWWAYRAGKEGDEAHEKTEEQRKKVKDTDHYCHLSVEGRLDIAEATAFREKALELLNTGKPLLLDMAGVTFLGSMGLGALVNLEKAARSLRVPLLLCAPSREVMKSLELAKLTPFFKIYPKIDEAVAKLPEEKQPSIVREKRRVSSSVINLVLQRRLDIESRQDLEALFNKLLNEKPDWTILELDLSHVDFVDSSGLTLLIKWHRLLQQQDKVMKLIKPSPRVAQIFAIAKVDRYLNVDV